MNRVGELTIQRKNELEEMAARCREVAAEETSIGPLLKYAKGDYTLLKVVGWQEFGAGHDADADCEVEINAPATKSRNSDIDDSIPY
jgi:hypothetical protein